MRLLDGRHDESAWLELWEHSDREPFAHPSYCRLFTPPGGRSVLVVQDAPAGPALIPLILRPGDEPPGAAVDAAQMLDASSPYGYGGPFGVPVGDVPGLLRQLREWAVAGDLCSVFLRLSLDVRVEPGPVQDDVEVVATADNVQVNLSRTPEEIWAGYDHKVRKNVKKAQRAGCAVTRDGDFRALDDFLSVYQATMARRNAAAWYLFDRAFFETLAAELHGSFSVFSVRDDMGRVVSVELVLESPRHLYSFLGGTLAEAFPLAPNDLLKHEVIEYGRATGREAFVLGGGAAPGDGIFAYKRSFDRAGVRTFHTARLIGDRKRYERCVTRWSRARGDRPPPADYFPPYRAPLPS